MIKRTLRLGTEEAVLVADSASDLPADLPACSRDLDTLAGVLARSGIAPHATMVDCGDELGLSTLLMARFVPRGRVLVLQASRAGVDRVRANLQANGVRNVDFVDEVSSHESRAVPRVDAHLSTLPNVSFFRLASEGREPDILDGARALIDRDDPAVFLEFNAWTLNAYGDHSPAAFAKALWGAFEVVRLNPDGGPRETPAEPLRFLYENLLGDGCVSEVLLRKRPGSRLIDQPAFSPRGQDPERLQAQYDAVLHSTSWRLTRPLRWAKRRLG